MLLLWLNKHHVGKFRLLDVGKSALNIKIGVRNIGKIIIVYASRYNDSGRP